MSVYREGEEVRITDYSEAHGDEGVVWYAPSAEAQAAGAMLLVLVHAGAHPGEYVWPALAAELAPAGNGTA